MSVMAVTSLFITFVGIKRKSFDISCSWLKLNQQHQQLISRRVEFFSRKIDQDLKRCLNQKGSITPFALIVLVLCLLCCWMCLANILTVRKTILQREQILACTAWLENSALKYSKKMDQLNSLIKKTRLMEMSLKITVAAAAALHTQRLLLEIKQQQLTLSFSQFAKMPFKLCRNPSPMGLILFQHVNLFLIRNPTLRTVNLKPMGMSHITLENFKLNLMIYRTNGQYQFKRFLYEEQR